MNKTQNNRSKKIRIKILEKITNYKQKNNLIKVNKHKQNIMKSLSKQKKKNVNKMLMI